MNFFDLGNCFAQDHSPGNITKVNYVINGYFKENTNYTYEVKHVVMTKLNLKYTKNERRKSEGVYYMYGNLLYYFYLFLIYYLTLPFL